MSFETLPHNWSWVKLGDVCDIVMGQSPPSSTYNTEEIGLPFFQGKAEFTELYPIVRKWCSEPNKIAEPLDILVSVRAPVGSSNIANHKCCIGRGLAALRYPDCNKYIFYYIRLIETELDKLGTGSTFKAISSSTLKNVEIPLPPLPEQKKIVEKIEELFSHLDSGVASLKKAKEQIRLYRQSVLASAFSGRLHHDSQDLKINRIKSQKKSSELINPENLKILVNPGSDNLPDGWKWVKLGDVSIKIGDVDHKMPKQIENGKYPYLSTKDFADDLKISFDKAKYISEKDFIQLSKKIKPEKGDIIFPRYGTIGKNVLVDFDKEFLVSYSCAIIKPNLEKIISKYLYLYTLSPIIKEEIKKYTVQTTQANVGIESIKNFILPLPSRVQQTQIVEEIEKRFSEADNLEKAIDESLTKAETLRQSILKKAFEGRLI